MRPGAYNQDSLIEYLEDLHDHLGGDKITQIYEGTNQIQRVVIAKKLLG
jgi:alkylation response protein AidB-like acyl-CoA dehydrogenase